MKNEISLGDIDVSAEKLFTLKRETNNGMEKSRKLKELLKFLGPAFVVSVAYIDPGNFATNISGGSKFNYVLIWVILWSNLMAIFLQTMSAKLGIATGKISLKCALRYSLSP